MAGFIKEKTLQTTPIVKNDFRHALCTGETGCGKTTSFMLPNIEDRIQNNYAMLIIDIKGNLHLQVKTLAEQYGRLQDVKEIGVAWGDKINLFENISRSHFLDMLSEIDGKDSHNTFWLNSALNIAGFIYDIFDLYSSVASICPSSRLSKFSYQFNPTCLNEVFTSFESLKLFILDCELIVGDISVKQIARMVQESLNESDAQLLFQYSERFKNVVSKVRSFHQEIDQDSPSTGQGGVFMHIKNILQSFTVYGLDGEDEIKELLEDGKIIIINASAFDENVTLAIMNVVYQRLLKRYNDRPISLFIDEFQRSISKKNIPYVDLFREMKVELIAAIQNLAQLENKLGQRQTDEFLGNILHKYEFANYQENMLSSFEYIHNKTKLIAKPIFLSKQQQERAQVKWQNIGKFPLTKEWVYFESIGHNKVLIQNIHTRKLKSYYLLEETSEELICEILRVKSIQKALVA